MSQNRKEKGNCPPLRFPEFTEEWKKTKLGKIADIVGGGTPDTTIADYWNGNIQWFTPSEIKSNYVHKSERTITTLGLQKSSAKLLPSGTILLTTRATIGEVAIAIEECTTNQGFQSLIVNNSIDSVFIFNWIKQNKHEFVKRANGSTFAEINKLEVNRIPLFIPSISEQTKIASFLSLIDQRIETQRKIIEKYESLIKGIADMLFRNKQKNIRLKDCVVCHSSSLTESEAQMTKGIYPVYGAAGIFTYSTEYNINEDSVLIIKDGSNVGKLQYASGKHSVIGTLNFLTPQKDNYLKYIYYYLQAFDFDKYKVGSGIPHIYFKDYGNESIYYPDYEEQKRIANALSAIDHRIQTEKDIFENYIKQKKYLLQNLFI